MAADMLEKARAAFEGVVVAVTEEGDHGDEDGGGGGNRRVALEEVAEAVNVGEEAEPMELAAHCLDDAVAGRNLVSGKKRTDRKNLAE